MPTNMNKDFDGSMGLYVVKKKETGLLPYQVTAHILSLAWTRYQSCPWKPVAVELVTTCSHLIQFVLYVPVAKIPRSNNCQNKLGDAKKLSHVTICPLPSKLHMRFSTVLLQFHRRCLLLESHLFHNRFLSFEHILNHN